MSTRHYYRSSLRRSTIITAERFAGSHVDRYLAELGGTERLSREELAAYQWRKFQKLIAHAYAEVPYYRRLLDQIGAKPRDFQEPSNLARIPILTKKTIRENLNDLQATNRESMRVVRAQTGGTTGEPLKFLRNVECNSLTRAALLRSYHWTGYRIGDPMLFLTGGSLLAAPQTLQQKLSFTIMNFHFMPGFRLSREVLYGYVNAVRAKQIRYLRGYSTLLHLFASLCEEEGINDIHLGAVYPTAEMLTTAQRDTIERVFHCKVYDHYGCAEVNQIANECPEGRRLHLMDEHVLMEEVAHDGDHALVVTDLDNYAQPFIRYANADRGRLRDGPCECGRNLTVLDELLGRSSDAIVLESGERYPGVFFHHLFGHFAGVSQFQVIQDKPGEFVVKIIRNDRYNAGDEAEIGRLIMEHTGIHPSIEYPDAIQRAPSGKITSVICNVQ